MKAHLIQIDATNTGGVAVSLYLSSVDDPACCHLNGQQWTPAISRLPALRYDFFGGSFDGQIASPSASFSLSIDGIPNFSGVRFARARVRLWTGELGDPWSGYALRFDGRITAEPTSAAGAAQFDAGPDDAWLDKPLLALYAGTGGAEGPDDMEGQPKPLALGNSRFVPGVLVDAVDNVWQVSGYGSVQAVNKSYDRVVALGGPVANHASYAALVAASIPNGSTATCLALGLVRFGAPADGQVSFDISGDNAGAGGYVRRAGALIRRIAEIAGGTVDAANLAALDTARPYNLSLVLTEQTTAREAIQQIADSVCAVAGITWTGTLFVQPLGYTAPSLTLASDGTALPPVESVEVQPVAAPFWRLATDAEISWVNHSSDQVASEYVLRGLYNAARVYRLDDMVSLDDGSAWVYINATPSAGNAPPAWPTHTNAWWVNVGPPSSVTWENVADPNGTKPEDNATNGANPEQVEAIFAPRIELSNPASTTWAYENGVVVSYADLEGQLYVIAGGEDVTASATLSATGTSCTGTINTAANTPVAGKPKGFYRITAMSADHARLNFTAVYGPHTRTASFVADRIKAGYQRVTSLPTTGLFPDMRVSFEGRLWVNKSGTVGDWVALTDTSNVGQGGNRLAGVIPATNPNRYLTVGHNPDGVVYGNNGLGGTFLSPAFGTGFAGPDWTLPDNSTFAVVQPNSSGGASGNTEFNIERIVDFGGNKSYFWNVEPNKTYEFSFYSGAHRCTVLALIIWVNTAGAEVGRVEGTFNASEALGGRHLFQYKRIWARGKAPATAVNAILRFRKYHTNAGMTDSWVFGAMPMFGETAAEPTGLLPWNMPGHALFNAEVVVARTLAGDKLMVNTVTAAEVATNDLITLSAQIRNAIIRNAHIGDLEVNTLKIAGNAVSVSAAAGQVAVLNIPAGNYDWHQVVPLFFTPGADAMINFDGWMKAQPGYVNGWAQLEYRITDGLGNTLRFASQFVSQTYDATLGVSLMYNQNMSLAGMIFNGAPRTYSLDVRVASQAYVGNLFVTDGLLRISALKR